MIPTIEQICKDLFAARITVDQAIAWLKQHAQGAANERREMLAAVALQGILSSDYFHDYELQGSVVAASEKAVAAADAMMAALDVGTHGK